MAAARPVLTEGYTSLLAPLALPKIRPQNTDAGSEIQRMWIARKCFVCQRFGRCKHREPAVEMAILEAWRRKRG